MLPFFLLSRKEISVLIRAVMVAALKLDGDYCCCSVATEMENEKKKKVHFCVAHRREREREGKRKRSLMKGGFQCPLFLLQFMNISGDERNKAWGSSRWKSSITSREVQTPTFFLSLTHTQWSTQVMHRWRCTRGFSICNQTQRGELSTFAFAVLLYLASKFRSAIKAKFSMT